MLFLPLPGKVTVDYLRVAPEDIDDSSRSLAGRIQRPVIAV